MLNLILGRSGNGKTEYVHDLLGKKATAGEEKLLLIVPEQFSYTCERSLLEKFGPESANRIEVLSFTRLTNYVNREIGGLTANYADDSAKLILMLKTLNILSKPENEEKLDFYKKHVNSIPLARQLLKLVKEFYRQKITPEMLKTAAECLDGTLKKKLRELSLIFSLYDALLSSTFANDDTNLDDICRIAYENDFFNGYTIAIDAFKGFTSQEYEVIKVFLKQADEVYLTLCVDCKVEELDTSMIFDSVNLTLSRIREIAHNEGVGENTPVILNEQKRFKCDELKYLEKNAFSATAPEYGKDSSNIELCVADTKRNECNFIAASIRKLIRKEDIRLSDIAVIVRNESEYNRELVAAFKRFEIPVFEDVRQPITNQPIIAYVRAILRILSTGFTTENILNYLKTSLSPISVDSVSNLENYALMWNAPAQQWRFGFAKENSPAGLKELKSDAEKQFHENAFIKIESDRDRIISPLIKLEEDIKKAQTAKNISKLIYNFLISSGVSIRLKEYAKFLSDQGFTSLAGEQERVWDILMDILDRIAVVYGNEEIKFKTYNELFDAVVSITTLGSIPHGLDEVTIGSADRARLSSPKVVFLAGCAEGVFPATIGSNGLLSNTERRLLEEKANLELSPSVDKLAAEERFIAYSALSSASEKLIISYHQTSGATESLSPSIIYNSVAKLFKTEKIGGKDFVHETETSKKEYDFLAETRESTFLAFAESIPKATNDEWEQLNTFRDVLKDDESFKDKFEAIDRIIDHKPQKLTPAKAVDLFEKDMSLSASRVEVFHKCKFKYFCQYGLYAYPREKAVITPAISGTVIHYCLENIIKEANGKDNLIKYSTAQRQAVVKKWLKDYLDKVFDGRAGKASRFLYLYDKLEVHLCDIVDRLCEEFTLTDFEPCDFELKLESGSSIEPYFIDLGAGNGSIKIRGSIDRVDKFEKDGVTYIRVIDYKSGGKEFRLSDIVYGINMQMLIYLFAIEKNGSAYYNSPIESAGILYYPAKRASLSSTRKDTDLTADKTKSDHENGLYRSDEFILEAMEHGQNDLFIPISAKNASESLVTLEELGRIRRKIEEIIKEMGNSLHAGDIEVKPFYESDYSNACKWCDYHSICGFEDGDPILEFEKKKNSEVLVDLLEEGSEEHVD